MENLNFGMCLAISMIDTDSRYAAFSNSESYFLILRECCHVETFQTFSMIYNIQLIFTTLRLSPSIS